MSEQKFVQIDQLKRGSLEECQEFLFLLCRNVGYNPRRLSGRTPLEEPGQKGEYPRTVLPVAITKVVIAPETFIKPSAIKYSATLMKPDPQAYTTHDYTKAKEGCGDAKKCLERLENSNQRRAARAYREVRQIKNGHFDFHESTIRFIWSIQAFLVTSYEEAKHWRKIDGTPSSPSSPVSLASLPSFAPEGRAAKAQVAKKPEQPKKDLASLKQAPASLKQAPASPKKVKNRPFLFDTSWKVFVENIKDFLRKNMTVSVVGVKKPDATICTEKFLAELSQSEIVLVVWIICYIAVALFGDYELPKKAVEDSSKAEVDPTVKRPENQSRHVCFYMHLPVRANTSEFSSAESGWFKLHFNLSKIEMEKWFFLNLPTGRPPISAKLLIQSQIAFFTLVCLMHQVPTALAANPWFYKNREASLFWRNQYCEHHERVQTLFERFGFLLFAAFQEMPLCLRTFAKLLDAHYRFYRIANPGKSKQSPSRSGSWRRPRSFFA